MRWCKTSMLKIQSILLLFLVASQYCNAQFVTVRATNSSQFLSDNLYASNLSRAIGAEAYFSKSIAFIPLPINYNVGIDYKSASDLQEIFLVTGLSYVTLTPSGFSAANAESVTYTTSNWLNYADINMYNGVQLSDSTKQYKLAGEICYNVGYVFGKSFFIHTGFGGRYNYLPANKNTELQSSSVDVILKIGILWKFKRKFLH